VLRTAEFAGDFSVDVVEPDRLVVHRRPVPPDRTESAGSAGSVE
jgi:hypothetical protein